MVNRTSFAAQNNSMLSSMSSSQANLQKIMQQITSQKKVNNPSDDPVSTNIILKTNTQLSKNADYLSNINLLKKETAMQDSAFSQIIEDLNRVNELALSASSGHHSQESLQGVKAELNELKKSIIQQANAQYDGKYIFGGSNTAIPPFKLEDDGSITYNGTPTIDATGASIASTNTTYKRNVDINENVNMAVNFAGDEVFGFYSAEKPDGTAASGYGLFNCLAKIDEYLAGEPIDQDGIREELDVIQKGLKNLSAYQTKNGINASRIEMAENSLEDNKILLVDKRSSVQDIDIAEAYSNYSNQYYAYQASLQMSSSMLGMSLLNYI